MSEDFLTNSKAGQSLPVFLEQLHKQGIEKILEGELDAHLDNEKHQKSKANNLRNGYTKKKLKTTLGETAIQVPRERDSSFSPMIVKKRESATDGVENVIISLYAKGMSNSDIEEQIRELYDFNISTSTISRKTERITADIIAWKNRPLEATYLIVWMDEIVFKVRENSKVVNKTIYIAVGLTTDGKKEDLGLWLGKNESSAF